MGRIWQGLRLGLKSLMLHKLRSGLTALGLIFGVAAVISMLAVGEGASREAQVRIEQLGATNIILRSVKPTEEVQAAAGRSSMILRYGLSYADYERIVETVPTVRRVLPVREIRKRSADSNMPSTAASWARRASTPPSITSRSSRGGSSIGPTTSSSKTTPSSRMQRPRPYSPTRTPSVRRSTWGTTRTRSSA